MSVDVKPLEDWKEAMIAGIVRSPFFCLVLFIFLSVGCASTPTFHITMDGFLNTGDEDRLEAGDVFYVLEPEKSPNPLLDQKMKARINESLEGLGFRVGSLEEAAWCLQYRYGSSMTRQIGAHYAPYWGPYPYPGFGVGYGYPYGWGWTGWDYWGYYQGGYDIYSYPVYLTFLDLRVLKAADYRNKEEKNPLWIGHAWCRSRAYNLRGALAAMLPVLFEFIGRDTPKPVVRDINPDAPGLSPL